MTLQRAAMFFFWGIVVAGGLCNRAFSVLTSKAYLQTEFSEPIALNVPEDDDPLARKASRLGCLTSWLKAYLIIPAAFGYKKAQPFDWYTVPPRIETLTILLFVIMNIVFTVYGYYVFPENL